MALKLGASETVALPQAVLFARLSDLDALMAGLGLSDEHLTRSDPGRPVGVRSSWSGKLQIKGVERPVTAQVTRIAPPETLGFDVRVEGLQLDALLKLAPAEERAEATRLTLDVELVATTIGGRVLLQTVRLAGGDLAGRLQNRLSALARRLEASA